MNDDLSQTQARRAPRLRASPVWLIPLAAALVGGWLFYQDYVTRGPLISLRMPSAEGIEAGKTAVKLRSVDVGIVRKVRLADDYEGAVLTIRMEPEMAPLMVADAGFWVVKPRVGRQGISGLSTIISGAYIQMQLGESEQERHEFEVLEHPPVTRPGVSGVTLTLISGTTYALAVGDPVIYQGKSVGRVETSEFLPVNKRTRHQIFVEAPYDKLITQATQFWVRSGVDIQWTPEGVELQLGNLQSLLAGGVSFATPETPGAGPDPGPGPAPQAIDEDEFQLFKSREEARQARFDLSLDYLVFFNETLKYLYPESPVEFRGVRVGTVAQAPYSGPELELPKLEDKRVPVLITIEPQRIGGSWARMSAAQWREQIEAQFADGLQASLETSNVLTGAQYIGLNFSGQAKPRERETVAGYSVFPSGPGGFSGIEKRVNKLLDKLNSLEINPLLSDLRGTLSQTQELMRATQGTMGRFNELLNAPGSQSLPNELNATLNQLQKTLGSFQQGQPAYQSLQQSLDRLNQLLGDLAPLARTLEQQPNSLIFGKEDRPDPQPKAPR